MNNEKINTIKRINIESFIWIVYIFLVCFNLYSNYLEKLYIETNKRFYKQKFRQINKIVLSVILIIYIYFAYLAFKDETTLSLYVATKNDDFDEELPLI